MTDEILPHSIDAKVWAKEFNKIFPMVLKDGEGAMSSEDLMITWFASAIMAGFDEANRRNKATPAPQGLVITIEDIKELWIRTKGDINIFAELIHEAMTERKSE